MVVYWNCSLIYKAIIPSDDDKKLNMEKFSYYIPVIMYLSSMLLISV